MRKFIVLTMALFTLNTIVFAGDEDSLKVTAEQIKQYKKYLDSVDATMRYETGKILLPGGAIELNVPAGFKFLNKEQSNFLLTEIWGNPPQTDVLGMLFPASAKLSAEDSYTFVISFEDMGYVKDKDANKINYQELMEEVKKAEPEQNKKRIAMGYSTIEMIGWAQPPFYDKEKKVLHWAKEFKFGGDEVNTLNYDIRVLGRKGVLSLNAIGTIDMLDDVKKDINNVMQIAYFTPGNRYEDFDSKNDKVAAYTVGGLVAGKILAKAGAFKFLKILLVGLVAVIGGAWKWISGRRKKKQEAQELAYQPAPAEPENPVNP